MSYEIAIQAAIHGALSSDSALSALVTGVYDSVPQNETFPYVTVGEDVHGEWDTNTTLGSDCIITIHSWSRGRGRKETKEIQAAIYDALHLAALTYSGYKFNSCYWQSSSSFVDADGLTRHGVSSFRVLIERI